MSNIRLRPELRFAWRGPSLLITNARGECRDDESLSGFYFRETRYLRTLQLALDGVPPWPCAVSAERPDELDLILVHPELSGGGGGGSGEAGPGVVTDAHGTPRRAVEVRLRLRVRLDGLDVSLTLTNHAPRLLSLDVAWLLAADFADLQEAFAATRQQQDAVEASATANGVRFRYSHPELPLDTMVAASGAEGWSLADGRLHTRVALEPQAPRVILLRITAIDSASPLVDLDKRQLRQDAWHKTVAAVSVPANLIAERIIGHALRDVGWFPLLEGDEDEWLAPAAGIPLYPALFGRDAITTGWQVAMFDQGEMLDATLTRLARLQGTRVDRGRDEEPGRIVQQARRGPLARLGINPFARYYADFASPLMYVIALGHLYAWSGERRSIDKHWDAARRALDWAREYGDRDGDGYLEYLTTSAHGPTNQGWKDSGDAIVYDDGAKVPAPVATCEIQGYWYAAQQLAAVMSWVVGDHAGAKAYWRSARELKERFNRDFWMEDEGFVALALDADKRQVKSIGSNAGHALASGIVGDAHIPRLVDRLFAPDLFSGWGIRTLSSQHVSYNPLSYHLGSVWAVENGTIAFGLRRFGFDARALELAGALFELAERYDGYRIPECVGGLSRAEFSHPGAYPQANAPQAWNQSVFPLLVHTILGLQPVAAMHLLIVDPVLPSWLPELTVHDLRLGGATATIRFHRDDRGKSHSEIVRQSGTLHLVTQPPIDSLTAGIGDRLGALIESMLPHRSELESP
jgi:glycogen debranching enzyme